MLHNQRKWGGKSFTVFPPAFGGGLRCGAEDFYAGGLMGFSVHAKAILSGATQDFMVYMKTMASLRC